MKKNNLILIIFLIILLSCQSDKESINFNNECDSINTNNFSKSVQFEKFDLEKSDNEKYRITDEKNELIGYYSKFFMVEQSAYGFNLYNKNNELKYSFIVTQNPASKKLVFNIKDEKNNLGSISRDSSINLMNNAKFEYDINFFNKSFKYQISQFRNDAVIIRTIIYYEENPVIFKDDQIGFTGNNTIGKIMINDEYFENNQIDSILWTFCIRLIGFTMTPSLQDNIFGPLYKIPIFNISP